MTILISAAFASALGDGIPAEVVFIPEGRHKITPQSHPQGITVSLPPERGAEVAAKLQAALDGRLKSNVRPWFDFEHKNGKASALPKSFRYEAGKGVMCAVEWTGSGRAALENKDFSYLSPVFLIGDDGLPSGLPERGPLAGILNEPAFREIPRIAAGSAAPTHEPSEIMKQLLAALNISPDSANAETAAVTAVETLKASAARTAELEKEITGLKDQVEAAENAAKETRKEQGASLHARAVAAGVAEDGDESVKAEYIAAVETGNKLAVKFLTERVEAAEKAAQPPRPASDLAKPLIAADAKQKRKEAGEHAFITAARGKVTAGEAKTEAEAHIILAAENPDLYDAYCNQFATDI